MGKDQDIRLNVEAKGAEKAAADVGKVDAAQKGLTDKTKEAVKPAGELDEATKKLAATEETYTTLLSRMHPALGAMADVMVKGSKVAGDLASQEINLADMTKKATAAFQENANTIKLLGAAGVAAVGFTALAKSIKFVIDESKALREELAKLREEQTGEEQELMAGQREVVNIARMKRREGVFTPEEKAQADYLLRVGGDRVPEERMPLFKQNVAALVGLKTGREIEALTMAGVGIPLEGTAESRRRRADAMLQRDRTIERTRAEDNLKRTERERLRTEAKRELESTEPLEGMGQIKAFLEDYQPMGRLGPVDKDKLIAVAREYYRLKKEKDEGKGFRFHVRGHKENEPDMVGWSDQTLREEAVTVAEPTGFWGQVYTAFGGPGLTRQIGLEHVLHDLIQVLDRQSREPSTTTYNNCRFMSPDSHARERETRNGWNHSAFIGDG